MASDFIKEKKTRRLATKAVIAMGVVVLLVVGLNAGLTAAIVFLSRDTEVDSSGRIMVAGTDTPATIENPHITTRTLNTSLTVAGENRFLSEAPTAEVLVDAYGGAIAVAPLTNEANMLLSACAKQSSNPVALAPHPHTPFCYISTRMSNEHTRLSPRTSFTWQEGRDCEDRAPDQRGEFACQRVREVHFELVFHYAYLVLPGPCYLRVALGHSRPAYVRPYARTLPSSPAPYS